MRIEVEKNEPTQLRRAIERLRTEDDVDVIWVLNDNALLQPDMIRRGWLPALRPNRTPVLVNVGSLLSDRVDFGTFAVLPDHRGLGVQAAGLITQLGERRWNASSIRMEYPLSVEKVLNVDFAREYLGPQRAAPDDGRSPRRLIHESVTIRRRRAGRSRRSGVHS